MTIYVDAIRSWTAGDFAAAVDTFADQYKRDFESWLATNGEGRPAELGRILRRWQATRGRVMRRTRLERRHKPPFLDDFLAEAPAQMIETLTTTTIRSRTAAQEEVLRRLWATFGRLPVNERERAKAVGITKAVMLVTDGRIGPGLDSNVRKAMRVAEPTNANQWIEILDGVAGDIDAFTARNGPLSACVRPGYRHLADGRLYDMALGPRDRMSTTSRLPNGRARKPQTVHRLFASRDRGQDDTPFGLAWCAALGYRGFIAVGDLRRSLHEVELRPGIYVVFRLSAAAPSFRTRSSGGWFKGKDPTVPVDVLRSRWHAETPLLYVGKANSLRRRVRALLQFGAGDPIGHWGGRYLWQLADSESLLVAWRDDDDPRGLELQLLAEFRSQFGSLPFANIST